MTHALTVADINGVINHEPRIMDLRLAEALGFAITREIKRLIERHREALERFGEVCVTATQTLTNKGGRPGKTYWLTKKQALYICTKSETPAATETTIQMVDVFDAYLAGQQAAEAPQIAPAANVQVKAHKRRKPRVGQGIVIASDDDGLYPFIEQGDELHVDFNVGQLFDLTTKRLLVLTMHPAGHRTAVLCLEQDWRDGKAYTRQIGARRDEYDPGWKIIGRVIGVNKTGKQAQAADGASLVQRIAAEHRLQLN